MSQPPSPTIEPAAVATHAARFVDAIARSLDDEGFAALSPPLLDAVRATPRHLFVRRFTAHPGGAVHDFSPDAPEPALLELIYRDTWLGHVDPAGAPLMSTNSVPSYILRLLEMLGLEPGQRALEIGSGSGWLVALMGRLVGDAGRVVGVEIIESLVEQSRASLAAAGLTNVHVHCGDGALGYAPAAPFDRAMVTAGTYDLPRAWFEQVREGGWLLVPLVDPSSATTSEVVLLERRGAGFRKRRSVRGHFVPFTGSASRDNPRLRTRAQVGELLASLPESSRYPLRFGAAWPNDFDRATEAFRMYLARRDSRYVVAAREASQPASPGPQLPVPTRYFGLAEADGSSVALCTAAAGLTGYGTSATSEALLAHYAAWCRFGMPGVEAFDLVVEPAGATPAAGEGEGVTTDVRGDAVLRWSLREDLAELPAR